MATFKDIEKVNKEITTTNIKGKEYAEVNQRIIAFRKIYPEGFIKTKIISLDNGIAVIAASVGFYKEDGTEQILGTGTAYEKETGSFINKTSYIENCETSAVGRALGMCALGVGASIASYEEVSNAILNQNAPDPIPEPAPVQNSAPVQKKLLICDRCRQEVKPVGEVTAEQIVKASKKQFKKCLCMKCGRLEKKEQEESLLNGYEFEELPQELME